MAVQALLDFKQHATPSIDTLNGMIYMILSKSGDWWTPAELIRAILNRHNVLISDSSATARLRDLRKTRYGAHIVEKRHREGSRAYEYRLVKP